MATLQTNQQTNHPARGFAQNFGLHPLTALLTLGVDLMLFTGELASAGVGVVLSVPVSAAVGFLAYRSQINLYGDEPEVAKVKAGAVALLTAIPTSLPMCLYLPAGFLGLFRRR